MDVPVVDLAGRAVAAEVDAACRDIGFFSVVGHDVPGDVVAAAWGAARAFFDLPMSVKLRSVDPAGVFGYSPFAAEALARTRGDAAPPDLKESFNLAPLDGSDVIWPDQPDGFREAWTAYYRAMERLAGGLLAIFAESLGVAPQDVTRHFGKHTSALRALNYPALERPPAPGQVRAGAHSDYGSLTILLPGPGRGGLEVLTRGGEWLAVPVVPGGFVVNIGDLMQRWTNDRWISTLHRVVLPPAEVAAAERRQSMAFFQNPDRDARIEVLPAGGEPRYEPIVFGEWLDRKVAVATESVD